MKRTIFLFLIIFFLSLTGCNLLKSKAITLLTDRAEMAAYVEHFNGLGQDYRVEIAYTKKPELILGENGKTADLIIGSYLNSPLFMEQFEPLDKLFTRNRIDREAFYPELLDRGRLNKKQVLLPISFNLPAVFFKPEVIDSTLPGMLIPLAALREQGAEYNRLKEDRFIRMGFSPLWEERFLYLNAVLWGTSFNESGGEELAWDQEAMQKALDYSRIWINQDNRGVDKNIEFVNRYLYEPMVKLVEEERVLFYLTSSAEFFSLLEGKGEERDFRWLSHEDRIPVEEEILFIGIPGNAKNKKSALVFLEWFFAPDTQQEILKVNHRKRLKVFGIGNGFSALQKVNELIFPQAYAMLIGHIPAAKMLSFPQNLPSDWREIKSQVIFPWLLDSLTFEQEQSTLKSSIQAFRAENLH
jgi:ABC-type glycerol-3-phosphate transport system substrate-binding protein